MKIEEIQEEYLNSVTLLADDISKINTYADLLAQEKKIQSLNELFYVAKNLATLNKYQIPEKNIPTEISSLPEQDINIFSHVDFKNIQSTSEESKAEEALKVNKNAESSKLFPSKVSSKKIMMDINDRFAFVSQLFGGNVESLDSFIQNLNQIQDHSESKKHLQSAQNQYHWVAEKREFVERLEELNDKRFD